MDLAAVKFADAERPERSGALAVDEAGRIVLRASPALADALRRAVDRPGEDLRPLEFDDRKRGISLAAALAKGVAAKLLECETVAGALEVRAFLGGGWVRLRLRPGEFDPDDAWTILLAANNAKLEAAVA
jgi:hypothetical protein